MEITINKKKENPLLRRVEISGIIKFDKETPSNIQVTESLAKELGTNINLVIVKKIATLFSKQEATFSAVSYQKNEDKALFEKMTKHLRKKVEEEAKKLAEAKLAEEEKKKAEEASKKEAEEKKEGEQ